MGMSLAAVCSPWAPVFGGWGVWCIPGAGGGPLDAFPVLPLPRHKASFLSLVPWLPRDSWGAGLGGGWERLMGA